MPKITPRFYTVASSPNYMKGKFEIAISLIEWKGEGNQTRYGITSSYYKNIQEIMKLDNGDAKDSKASSFTKTRVIVRDSSFKLPTDNKIPLVMICTGTGVAPFISFFQEFKYSSVSDRKDLFVFGSKNKKYDFIYEDDINECLDKNIIGKVLTAFSRDTEKKYYVQDVIKEKSEAVGA